MKLLVPVLMAVVLDLVGFGIVIPLLTFYRGIRCGPCGRHAADGGTRWLSSSWLPSGARHDKYGRRPIMCSASVWPPYASPASHGPSHW